MSEGRGSTVVVVEDSAATRRFLAGTLERAGLVVVTARDGKEAIEAVRERVPDAILLDLLLPDLSPAEVVAALRSMPGCDAVPIIAVTGWHAIVEDVALLPHGVDALLVKPVDVDLLLATTRRYLPPAVKEGRAAPRRHLLYVAEDAVQRRLGRLHFEAAGLRVTAVSSVAAARHVLAEDPPDVVVADALLPGSEDGYELCLSVRTEPRTSELPVVLTLPQTPEVADVEEARRVGASALVGRRAGWVPLMREVETAAERRGPQPRPELVVSSRDERERRLLLQLQRQMTLNAGLTQRCAQQGEQLMMLDVVSDTLAKTADVSGVLAELLRRCLEAGGLSRGALFRTGREGRLALEHAVGFSPQQLEELKGGFGSPQLFEQVMLEESARIVSRGGSGEALLARAGVTSLMLVPLVGGGLRLGVLLLASDDADMTRQDLLAFARTVGAYLGQALALATTFTRLSEAERRNEFLGVLAHELRSPLAPLVLALELMRVHEHERTAVARYRDTMGRQVRHLVRMVDDLLDASRLTHGKVQLTRERLDLTQLVREVVDDRRSVFEGGRCALSLVMPERPLEVSGDRTRLVQVFGNLLANAAKFTPAGGRVEVRVEAEPRHAVVTVTDTGVGIAPDMIVRLFEPFMQAQQSLDRSEGGLGLGLTVVKGLVELHEGEVHARSEGVGHGAAFTVRLPLLEVPDAPERPVSSRLAVVRAPAQLRVLIVEDNADSAALLQELLELSGYVVEVAGTGPAGVETARRSRPDVVICDIGLPGMDGYAVAGALRADPATRYATLIALSGYSEEEHVDRARAAGFDRQLVKPVRTDELLKVLAAQPRRE